MSKSDVEWNDLFLFSQVVERGSFTAAGDALGVPKSSVSRRISRLEAAVDTRLLQRNSRALSLTDAGQALYVHCRNMKNEADLGVRGLTLRHQRPAGQVRVSLPIELAEVFSQKLLPRFLKNFPAITLLVHASNRSIDLVKERIDVVVRGVGIEDRLKESSLVQSSVCTARWALLASPEYLSRCAPLNSPADLERVASLMYGPNQPDIATWRLIGADQSFATSPARVALESDNLAVLKQAALSGLGVTGMPLYFCSTEVDDGRLQIVLPPWRPQSGRLVVMFPSRQGLSPAARALVEFLKAELPGVVV